MYTCAYVCVCVEFLLLLLFFQFTFQVKLNTKHNSFRGYLENASNQSQKKNQPSTLCVCLPSIPNLQRTMMLARLWPRPYNNVRKKRCHWNHLVFQFVCFRYYYVGTITLRLNSCYNYFFFFFEFIVLQFVLYLTVADNDGWMDGWLAGRSLGWLVGIGKKINFFPLVLGGFCCC